MKDSYFKPDKFFKITLTSYFMIFLILISISQLAGEDDLFWYLSTGRYIVQNGAVPSSDVFGFTTSGMLWIPFEWGWDIVNYLLFMYGGYIAIGILSTLLILLIFLLLYRMFSNFNVNFIISLIVLVLLSFGMLPRLTIKPHLITYLSFAAVLAVIVRYRYFNRDNQKILYILPLIFFLWINMHMGVIAGMLILGIYMFSEITGSVFKNRSSAGSIKPLDKKQLTKLILIIILSILVTLINPHGFKTYEYAFHVMSLNQLDIINEWISPFSHVYFLKSYNLIYYLFIMGLIPVFYYSYKKQDWFPVLLSAGFFLYSVRANRLTVDFMIVTALFLAISIDFIIKKYNNTRLFSLTLNNNVIKVVFSVLLLFLIISTLNSNIYKWSGYERKFGFGIDVNNFPLGMYKFLKENKITEIGSRPFNTYETGGYFVWNFPGRKNFIGSRSIDDKVWNDYLSIINIQPGFEDRIDSLNFDYFIWMVPLVNYSQAPSLLDFGILSYLFRQTDKWRLVYWDDKSFLFLKNTPLFDEVVMRNEYRFVNPYNFFFRKGIIEKGITEEKETILRELSRKQKEDPNGIFQKTIRKEYENRLE